MLRRVSRPAQIGRIQSVVAIIEAISPRDPSFRQQADDAWLASPVQVYLNLIRGEARTKELAEHLRITRIGF
jgi:hypothetical protein